MQKQRIPFVPFPLEKAKKFARPFLGISSKLVKFFPWLNIKLLQAGIDLSGKEYLSISIFSSFFWFLLIFSLLGIFLIKILTFNFLLISLFASFTIAFLSFIYINLYPNLVVIRKIRDIDRNLLFAMRHLLIQVKSGVTLFNAMCSVVEGEYGVVSAEFSKCVKEMATGTDVNTALEEMAFKNPNLYFRRTIWQLVNSMRAGVDIGESLSSLVSNLSQEQRVLIRKYGSQLSPLALLYMMFVVIVPTLGITFLTIFSSVIGSVISEFVFYGILAALVFFQFLFIGFVKNRMPAVGL
ncbi:MAG: type II secretion system F family protein [Candidatus Aenigmarchaeota archaeon]|nr:type II secretion system F family protein [Candidatus Aenigmarchaeota archaeon]